MTSWNVVHHLLLSSASSGVGGSSTFNYQIPTPTKFIGMHQDYIRVSRPMYQADAATSGSFLPAEGDDEDSHHTQFLVIREMQDSELVLSTDVPGCASYHTAEKTNWGSLKILFLNHLRFLVHATFRSNHCQITWYTLQNAVRK
jgi:hypothetical protein